MDLVPGQGIINTALLAQLPADGSTLQGRQPLCREKQLLRGDGVRWLPGALSSL